MTLRPRLKAIVNQCPQGIGVTSIEPNRAERLIRELTECCLDQERRLQSLEGVRGAVVLDEVEQHPRVDGDVMRGKGKRIS